MPYSLYADLFSLSKFLTTVKGIDPEKKHELDSMRGMVDRFTNINTAGATDGPQVVVSLRIFDHPSSANRHR